MFKIYVIQDTIVQNLPNNVLERMLMRVEQKTLHDLKDAAAGQHDDPVKPSIAKPSNGSGNPRRLRKLQRAHHGNCYNSLKNLFGKIEIAY